MLSSYMALPQEGHLSEVLHIFAYLSKYHNAEMVFDPSNPDIDLTKYEKKDWASSEFGYIKEIEEVPKNMPEPRGLGFILRAKEDADHATNTIKRRSRTGFLMYANSVLVHWHSKKQNSVESSSFGAEFITMKQCCKYLQGFCYKLRMMGILLEEPVYVEGDNQSVLVNTMIPDSTIK